MQMRDFIFLKTMKTIEAVKVKMFQEAFLKEFTKIAIFTNLTKIMDNYEILTIFKFIYK